MVQKAFNDWGQVAVMLATAAGLFFQSWDQRETLQRVAASVAVLEERTRSIQSETERISTRVDRIEESGRRR